MISVGKGNGGLKKRDLQKGDQNGMEATEGTESAVKLSPTKDVGSPRGGKDGWRFTDAVGKSLKEALDWVLTCI